MSRQNWHGIITKARHELAGTAIILAWHIDDVIERAKENGKKITEEQAWAVLSCIDHKWDASIGVNWDILDIYIEDVLGGHND